MKRFVYLYTTIFFFLLCFSCERTSLTDSLNTDDDYETLVNQAKTSFISKVVQTTSQARIAGSGPNKFLPSNWQPQWDKAVTFSYQGTQVVEVPLLYGGSDITYKMKSGNKNYKTGTPNGVTKAIFFKHKDGTMGSYVMELILSDDYFQAKKNQYKDLSLQNVTKDFSGILNFTDLLRNSLANYRLEKGQVTARSKNTIASNKNGRTAYCELNYSCYSIPTTVTIGCCTDEEYGYNQNGNCCRNSPPPYTRWDTYCDYALNCYPDPPTEPSDNGGQGDTGNGAEPNYSDINSDISCTSFVFTKTSTYWQEAGVKGFYMIISYLDGTGRGSQRYDVPGQIVIGLPLQRENGEVISSGAAATIAAQVVDLAGDLTFKSYRNLQGTPIAQDVVRSFMNNLQVAGAAYNANVSTNGSGSPLILIKQSEFTFWGTGNCN